MGKIFSKTVKIYVAGHRGMVGSAIVRALKKKGYENIIMRTSQELDLTRQSQAEKFFSDEKPEIVILAAAKVGGIQANIADPSGFLNINLMIQNNVIHSAYMNNAEKLIFLGSSCIFPTKSKQPMKEEYLLTGPLEKTNEAYALAKIAGIKACEYYNSQHSCDFISVMPPNLYGVGDNFDVESSHVLAALIRKMHIAKIDKAPYVEVWGSGNQRREFMFADDLAEAVVFLMNNYSSPSFINAGVGQDWSIKELAEIVRDIVGYRGELIFNPEKPDGMYQKLLDSSKMKELGWLPEVPLKRGIEKTYEWYSNSLDGCNNGGFK